MQYWVILYKVSGYSSNFNCEVSGLNANANSNGNVIADDNAGSDCEVDGDGYSGCSVVEDGGVVVDPPAGPGELS